MPEKNLNEAEGDNHVAEEMAGGVLRFFTWNMHFAKKGKTGIATEFALKRNRFLQDI